MRSKLESLWKGRRESILQAGISTIRSGSSLSGGYNNKRVASNTTGRLVAWKDQHVSGSDGQGTAWGLQEMSVHSPSTMPPYAKLHQSLAVQS